MNYGPAWNRRPGLGAKAWAAKDVAEAVGWPWRLCRGIREGRSRTAAAVSRRKVIYETIHPKTMAGANVEPERQFVAADTPSFSKATASATGKDASTVRTAAARGKALGRPLLCSDLGPCWAVFLNCR
jgi:hypothetical protein